MSDTSEFASLCGEWRDDTEFLSNLSTIHGHPAYQRIIGMGTAALPLIFERLRDEGGHWFYALAVITGQDAATGHEAVRGARAAWLEWGAEHGYLAGPVPPCSKEHR